MRPDTPPPDDDAFSDGLPSGIDDIEIIEEYEIEEIEAGPEESYDGLYNEPKLTFTKHIGPIFCVDLDKSNEHAVTGSQDDVAIVWDSRTGDTLFECKGHKDSVFSVGFSYDSKYVASADMSGLVQVWNVDDSNTPVFSCDVADDLRFTDWNSNCNVLFAGVADGNCWMWNILTQQTKLFPGKNSSCSSGKIIPSGLKSVVGYEDGSIQVIDYKSTNHHYITGPSAHKGSITSIDCHPDNVLALTGSVDGTAKVLKVTDGKVLSTLRCEQEDSDNMSVESVGFFASHPWVATGTVNGSLAIWDVSTQVRRLQCEQEAGITKLFCVSSCSAVYTAGIDGVVRLIDVRTGVEENVWGKHSAPILDFVVSSDGNTLISCSDDATAKVFDTRST